MRLGRDPIIRGLLQSDLDGGGFNIRAVNAVANKKNATLIVDPSLATEIGIRGTGLPFRTLAAAVTASLPGDTIIMRPGVYAYDGVQDIFHLDGLTIIGKGAIIQSNVEINETTKITIRSADVSLIGLKFNGNVDLGGGNLDQGEGCVEVVAQPNATIRDCQIYHQAGMGIIARGRFDGLQILDCNINTCQLGFYDDTIGVTQDVAGLTIDNCSISDNRKTGISVTGPTVASGFALTRVRITNNRFLDNGTNFSGIYMDLGVRGAIISGNHLTLEYNAISVYHSQNVEISGNILRSTYVVGFGLYGCQNVNLIGNLLDGRNAAGTAITQKPVDVSGFYSAGDDAGPFLISGNSLVSLKTAEIAVSIKNTNSASIEGNRIEGTTVFAANLYLLIANNLFTIPQTTQAILIDAAERGCIGTSIIGNRFNFTGASCSRVVATIDASATLIQDLAIIGNSTPVPKTYSIETYGHSGANPPIYVVQRENTPQSTTRTSIGTGGAYSATVGWKNDEPLNPLYKTILVSQARGKDSTGARERDDLPFLTINAAINIAATGDLVLVQDGTFNERIDAKVNITVRFVDPAKLVCTSANGCIRMTSGSYGFSVYHEHTPIINSQVNVAAIQMGSFVGTYLALHASVTNSGATGNAYCVSGFDGVLEVWGNLYSTNSFAIANGAGSGTDTLFVTVHGGTDINACLKSGTANTVVDAPILKLTVIDGLIQGGGGMKIYPATSQCIFRRCTIVATAAGFAAVNFGTPDATHPPIFRDCVLVSEGTATKSINVSGAQNIILYGQTVANKGANPPTNVTFVGGGTYAVDAAVVVDQ